MTDLFFCTAIYMFWLNIHVLAENHPSYCSDVLHALQTEIIFITKFSGNVVQNLNERNSVLHAMHRTDF